MLAPGTVLQNRYRVVRQLGQGGMGTVYEAKALRLNTTVALKETHFTDERLRKQFEREAQLLASLRHAALPRVTDHFDEGDGLYLVMDFVEGNDLWEQLQKRGAFPVDIVLGWADQLLDALTYMHNREPPVIHRDIKPQNLKPSGHGQIILLDFGLAKGFAGQISRVTTSGSIFGYTPSYAPLEQIQGTGTDARSDLYSLAATLYHLMTGKVPPDVLTRVAETTDRRPDALLPANELNWQVPRSVADVLTKAMSVGRSQRYANAVEMREAVRGARQQQASSTSDAGETTVPIIVMGQSEELGEETLVSASTTNAIEFIGNDEAYLRWLGENYEGFVINTRRNINPNDMMLHRATCGMIKSTQGIPPGGFTERDYIKICAGNVEDLRAWATQHGRPDGSFSSSCQACKPVGESSPMIFEPPKDIRPGEVISIDEPVVAISIGGNYPKLKNAEDLYHVTRSMWRVNIERANRARYAFAVYHGEIMEVFEIERWIPATEATRRYWRERERIQGEDLQDTHDGRSEFIGKLAPEPIRKKYVGRLMPVRHTQNPIRYFNC